MLVDQARGALAAHGGLRGGSGAAAAQRHEEGRRASEDPAADATAKPCTHAHSQPQQPTRTCSALTPPVSSVSQLFLASTGLDSVAVWHRPGGRHRRGGGGRDESWAGAQRGHSLQPGLQVDRRLQQGAGSHTAVPHRTNPAPLQTAPAGSQAAPLTRNELLVGGGGALPHHAVHARPGALQGQRGVARGMLGCSAWQLWGAEHADKGSSHADPASPAIRLCKGAPLHGSTKAPPTMLGSTRKRHSTQHHEVCAYRLS